MDLRPARAVRALGSFALLLVSALVASAQTITDPRTAEFDPSPDHHAVTTEGEAIVSEYRLSLYEAGGAQAFETVSLGKPSPASDGKIRVDFRPLLTRTPTPGVVYEARVAAVGPGGAAASAASNPVSFGTACAPAVTPSTQSIAAAGQAATVTVTSAAGCAWTAASNATWIAVTSGASGSGNGSVGYSVSANTGVTARTGTITVAGHQVTVSQGAASCSYTLSTAAATVGTAGGANTVGVAASAAGCAWTAAANAPWIAVTSGASGTGNGIVGYSVSANTGVTVRTGTITIAGHQVTVSQGAASCSYTLSTAAATVGTAGGANTVGVAASAAGCAWTAASNAPWIVVTSGASGAGNGVVAYSVSANTGLTARTTTMTIAGQHVTVSQGAASCSYTLSTVVATVGAAGGLNTSAVAASAPGCAWTAVSNASWITVRAGGAVTGSGSVAYEVALNNTGADRRGTLTVAGQTLSVSQSGKPLSAPSNVRLVEKRSKRL